MLRAILMSLIMFSLSFSDSTVVWKYAPINDSTMAIRMKVPADSNVYTCFTEKKYESIGTRLGLYEIVKDQYADCTENTTRLKRVDSLNIARLDTAKVVYNKLVVDYADTLVTMQKIRADLREEKPKKFIWGIAGFSGGVLVTAIAMALLVSATK